MLLLSISIPTVRDNRLNWCAIGSPATMPGESITITTPSGKRQVLTAPSAKGKTLTAPSHPKEKAILLVPRATCQTGVKIVVEAAKGSTSTVHLKQLTFLNLGANAASFIGKDFTGQLDLGGSTPWPVDPATRTMLNAGPGQITVGVETSPGQTNLRIYSTSVGSANNDTPNLVMPYWDRQEASVPTDLVTLVAAAIPVLFSIRIFRRRNSAR